MIGQAPHNEQQAAQEGPGTTQGGKTVHVVAKRKHKAKTVSGADSAKTQIQPTGTGGNGVDLELNRTLTRVELKILKVLMDPTLADRTAEQRIEIAGVSRTSWFMAIRDPWFQEEQAKAVREHIAISVAPMLNASIETALKPGRDGFLDRRLMFEMGRFHIPKRRVEQTVTGKVAVGIVGIDLQAI